MIENPFDDFPKTYTYSNSLDMTFTLENCGPFAKWRAKWELPIMGAIQKAEKLGDISKYPEIKFGHMTVLDYFDLVELQADHYTKRALEAEKKLEAVGKIQEELEEWRGLEYQYADPHDVLIQVDDRLTKILETRE